MIYLYPYKLFSESARDLARGLGCRRVRPDGRFNPRRRDRVVNWGNSYHPAVWEWDDRRDLNNPIAVSIACNKTTTFNILKLKDIPIPEYTTEREVANEWLNDGSIIVARSILNGHSGQGISLHGGEFTAPLPHVPLYTKYKKKRAEYRVHVFKGEVIDTVQKKKRNAAERPTTFNTFVRNHANGWVYCRDGILPDPRRDHIAMVTINVMGLDFGAVDIIYNEHEDKYYVLEVNTAPGLEGTTLQRYLEVFRAM